MQTERDEANVSSLVEEYEAVLEPLPDEPSPEVLAAALRRECEWTEEGAAALVQLAQQYGSFVLRSALALALALDIEDGELEF
jgi:hypothetical protein